MLALGDVQATYRSFAVFAAANSPCFEQWTTDCGTVTAGSAPPTLRADVSGPAAST